MSRIKFVTDLEWMIVHGLCDKGTLREPNSGSPLSTDGALLYEDLGKRINQIAKQLDDIQSHRPEFKSPAWIEHFYEIASSLYDLKLGKVTERPKFVGKMMRCILQYFGFTLKVKENPYGNRVRHLISTGADNSRISDLSLAQELKKTGFIEELFEPNGREETRTIDQKLRLREQCVRELEEEYSCFVGSLLLVQFNQVR